MKIYVCVKQAPARDAALPVDSSGRWIDDEDLPVEMNEPDAFALEEALRLKESQGGEVVAITAGPERAASTLREALAKGADRAVLIEDDFYARADPQAAGRALAAAIGRDQPDLVLTGLQSDDAGYGQVGVVTAELLGLPHATIIMKVEVVDGSLRLKRELEAGWFQDVTVPLPAVLSIQSGINKVRYATLMGIKKARSKPLERLTPGDLGLAAENTQTVERLYAPEKSKTTVFLRGSAEEQAQQLIDKLRHEARVL